MTVRRRVAQLSAAAIVAAMFLPWEAGSGSEAPAVRGLDTDEGRVVVIVALITVVLVQIGWRPAWIGAGFVVAVAGRRLLTMLGDDPGPGIGLWVAAAAALAAAALLFADMFMTIDRRPPESGGDD